MELLFMSLGFLFAAYAVVGNDAIQTLGTFLSSNSKRPWWVLWLYISGIMVLVVLYGVYVEQDISFGKFKGTFLNEAGEDMYPTEFSWWFVIPPLVLLLITNFGIPVSTTFLIISVFSSKAIPKMLTKSLIGYGLAFVVGLLVYLIIARLLEKKFIRTFTGELPSTGWVVAQWLSTGFLWVTWLMQDMVNIFVYFYKPLKATDIALNQYIIYGTLALVIFQGILFYIRGGAIQKIVTSKTNTADVRSATIIDFIYGLILLSLKGAIPMSTTWVYVGLLAGREFALNHQLKLRSASAVSRIVFMDFLKIMAGLLVSVLLVILLNFMRG